MKRLRVGIIGVGKISGVYLDNLCTEFADRVELLGCADLEQERARVASEKHSLPKRYDAPENLIADPDIDLVINLTIPQAHFDVSLAAVDAGKHVYVEKPICVELDEAQRLLEAAAKRGVVVGGAPDTFLGAGIQTCKRLIEAGEIGKPVAATAFMTGHGHESWHPAPEFYYKHGGGPLFDMGPYYLTALVSLIGPVRSVTGSARISFAERTITSEPQRGKKITVEVPTHVSSTLDFANGAIGTMIMSFDVWAANLPLLEIYGSDGSLAVPDPNFFGGTPRIKRAGEKEWREVELTHRHDGNNRGLGVAEFADALASGRTPRTSGQLAAHILEVMHGIHIASDTGARFTLDSSPTPPPPLPSEF